MIAVCLSIYNGENFLRQQFKSIENQIYDLSKIILIVRDDGSNDKSYEILQDFANNTTLNIKILQNRKNFGVKKSFEILMNTALEINAQYIMFCDQDDVWNPNKIEKTYLEMKEQEHLNGEDISILIHSNMSVVDRSLKIISSSFWKYQNINPSRDKLNHLLLDNVVTGCTIMVNRALAEKVKNIPQEAIMHDWWIAMVASAFGKIVYKNESLMLYRQHSSNDTGAKKYGLKYIINRLFIKSSTGKFTSQLDKYIIQAQQFLVIYEHDLDNESKKMLQDFSRLPILNKWQKIVILVKYKIWKNGFMRNLGLILFA